MARRAKGESQLITLWLPKSTVQFFKDHCEGRGHISMMQSAITDLEEKMKKELEDDEF